MSADGPSEHSQVSEGLPRQFRHHDDHGGACAYVGYSLHSGYVGYVMETGIG